MLSKPNFVDRYALYTSSIADLNDMISDLEIVFQASGNELISRVLEKLKAQQRVIRNNEIVWSEEDIQEILDKPYLFPHAVVTWAAKYRDADLA